MSMSPPEPRHVLVLNQHGDNRGDEAAMIAMFDALASRLDPVRFTVLHQFNDPEASSNANGHDVQFVPLAPRRFALPRLALGAALHVLHLPWRGIAGPVGRDILTAYDDADLVVSAPGGPYFGDIYADHEPLHWAYVALAAVQSEPLFLYAPSAGPFRKRWMNPARRFVFRRFGRITVREERSAVYLRQLFGDRRIDFEVTIDAALGATLEPLPRAEWPGAAPAADRRIVAVSVIDYAYPGHADPAAARATHDDAVLNALAHVATRIDNVHIVFMPQVHGRHGDAPYLQRLADRLPPHISREVLSDQVSSPVQQRIFASATMVLAGRYHPAVFSVLSAVPVACVAYEHKSIGLMEAADLGHLAMPIETVTADGLVALVDEVIDTTPAIRERLENVRPELRARALRNADLAVATMDAKGFWRRRTSHGARPRTPPLTPMAWMRWDAVEQALYETTPTRILEVGAGQGAMGWRLAQRAEYLGVEPDLASYDVARARLEALGRGEVRHGDASSLRRDATFDLVCAFEVLEHIDDDEGALRSWREHLVPGGHLLLSVPAHQDRFGPTDIAVGHVRRYDRTDLETTLEKAGYRMVWVRGYGAGLGHALEATRNRLLRRRGDLSRDDATARSGRLFQPPAVLGPVVAAGVAPFRMLQAPFSARGAGVGYVVLAVVD
jgi:polysaccharide pyruvyl transferase WcaK-like protein/SAM-dependent methyltransferase